MPCVKLKDIRGGRWVVSQTRVVSTEALFGVELFKNYRRVVLRARMMSVRGRVHRKVIHVVSQRLDDLSDLLASVGSREDVASVYRMGRDADYPRCGRATARQDSAGHLHSGLPARLGARSAPADRSIKVKTRHFR